MKQRRFNKNQRRKISIFVRCIIISFIAWTLIAISNKYTVTLKTGIEYINIPEKRAFHPLQSDTVRVRVKMSGWDLLISKFNPDSTNIQVDLSNLKSRNFIVFSNQLGFINRQFPVNKQVTHVAPDTLYFDFSKQTQRKVPVKVPYNISFRNQYGIAGETKVNPAYVTITGPLEDVANIEFLETDTVRGVQIQTDVRTVANINRNQRANITIYPTIAEIVIPVGELTEKVIEVPLKIENAKKFTSVRTVPSKVTLTALVSLKDYNKWSARDFEAVVDLDSWGEHGVTSLPVILTQIPDFCKIIKIEPQNVDFFVRK
ncbi:hypothetical protein FAZ19_08025 [Sphingobacterium alkalisoli]|uniref:YbbR-like domain-containing protein n=1 Tax=Sphingobacterium alkalisoli TaxID=1874115 RepID=A0A4U0H5H0_9SPHI|nr:hypothetical protein [Sphingobacterium alkalisoli]TJY66846.1 hypothetical protein FAZ19_08025 [Sphingobacterium alkalisoli]GGH13862.1 hypothetical protein GCM10011418_14340 [Sphingobacterium alkalisoli]